MPRSLSADIDRIARQAIGKDWSLYASLLDHWAEIVGPEYARLATPVKIAFPPRQKEARREGGTLTIRLPKGLAMEFSFRSEQVKQRIAAYFGYEAITRIAFEPVYHVPETASRAASTPDPAALDFIRQKAKDIDDDELRNALQAFGESVVNPRGPLIN